jgi:hypothetical protein
MDVLYGNKNIVQIAIKLREIEIDKDKDQADKTADSK